MCLFLKDSEMAVAFCDWGDYGITKGSQSSVTTKLQLFRCFLWLLAFFYKKICKKQVLRRRVGLAQHLWFGGGVLAVEGVVRELHGDAVERAVLLDEGAAVDASHVAVGEDACDGVDGTAVVVGLPVGGDEYLMVGHQIVGIGGGQAVAVGVDDRRRGG